MSIKIISEKKRIKHVEYRREFQTIGEPDGCGFSFPCDKEGNLKTDDIYYNDWKKIYDFCVSNPDKFIDKGITEDIWTYMENAKALCICGKEIELYDEYMGACECPYCGRWYNLFGQELKNQEYWED